VEFDGDAGSGGLVAVDLDRSVDPVDHHVEISVLVEVAQGHAESQPLFPEPPLRGLRLERAVAPIAEGQVGRAPLRVELHPALSLLG